MTVVELLTWLQQQLDTGQITADTPVKCTARGSRMAPLPTITGPHRFNRRREVWL